MAKHIRSNVFIVVGSMAVCAFLLIVLCVGQFLWFRIETRYWEFKIRRYQNPAELQAWAINLLAKHDENRISQSIILDITNEPPRGFPVTLKDGVSLMNDKIWDGGYYVQLTWGSGVLGRWGLRIENTNYVCGLPDKWKPGIYFFSGP